MSWVLFFTWIVAACSDSITSGWAVWFFFLWIGYALVHDCRRQG